MCFTRKPLLKVTAFAFGELFLRPRILQRWAHSIGPAARLPEPKPARGTTIRSCTKDSREPQRPERSQRLGRRYRPLRKPGFLPGNPAVALRTNPFAAVHLGPLAALLIALCNQGSGMNWLAGFDPP